MWIRNESGKLQYQQGCLCGCERCKWWKVTLPDNVQESHSAPAGTYFCSWGHQHPWETYHSSNPDHSYQHQTYCLLCQTSEGLLWLSSSQLLPCIALNWITIAVFNHFNFVSRLPIGLVKWTLYTQRLEMNLHSQRGKRREREGRNVGPKWNPYANEQY